MPWYIVTVERCHEVPRAGAAKRNPLLGSGPSHLFACTVFAFGLSPQCWPAQRIIVWAIGAPNRLISRKTFSSLSSNGLGLMAGAEDEFPVCGRRLHCPEPNGLGGRVQVDRPGLGRAADIHGAQESDKGCVGLPLIGHLLPTNEDQPTRRFGSGQPIDPKLGGHDPS